MRKKKKEPHIEKMIRRDIYKEVTFKCRQKSDLQWILKKLLRDFSLEENIKINALVTFCM